MAILQKLTRFCAQVALPAVMLFVIAGSAAAQDVPENPVAWSLAAEKPAPQKPGSTFKALLSAKIEEGWHLYSTEQRDDGPKPTRIVVPQNRMFELAGEIESPTPIVAMDENFGFETEYYEGSATFALPLRVVVNASAGQHKLQVQVRYQTCTQKLCLPPKTVKLDLTVEVAQGR